MRTIGFVGILLVTIAISVSAQLRVSIAPDIGVDTLFIDVPGVVSGYSLPQEDSAVNINGVCIFDGPLKPGTFYIVHDRQYKISVPVYYRRDGVVEHVKLGQPISVEQGKARIVDCEGSSCAVTVLWQQFADVIKKQQFGELQLFDKFGMVDFSAFLAERMGMQEELRRAAIGSGLGEYDQVFLARQLDYAFNFYVLTAAQQVVSSRPVDTAEFLRECFNALVTHGDDRRNYLLRPNFVNQAIMLLRLLDRDVAQLSVRFEPSGLNDIEKKYLDYFRGVDYENAVLANALLSLGMMPIHTSAFEAFDEVVSRMIERRADSIVVRVLENAIGNKRSLLPGNAAPTIKAQGINGNIVSLESLRGHYVFIDFWGTWCSPCYAEFEPLDSMISEFAGFPVDFVSIAVWSDHETWSKVLNEHELKGLQLLAVGEQSSDAIGKYQIMAFPRFVVIDPQGFIIDANAPAPSQGGRLFLSSVINR